MGRWTRIVGLMTMAAALCCAPRVVSPDQEIVPRAYDHRILYRMDAPRFRSFSQDERFLRVDTGPSFTQGHILEVHWKKGGPVELLCQWSDEDVLGKALVEYTNHEGFLRIGLKRDVPVRMLRRNTADPTVVAAVETAWSQLERLTFYRYDGRCTDGISYEIETYSAQGLGRRLSLHPCGDPGLTGERLVSITSLLAELTVSGQIPEGWYSGFEFQPYAGGVANPHCTDTPFGQECLAALAKATSLAIESEPSIQAFVQPECPPEPKKPANAQEAIELMRMVSESGYEVKRRDCKAEKYAPDRKHF